MEKKRENTQEINTALAIFGGPLWLFVEFLLKFLLKCLVQLFISYIWEINLGNLLRDFFWQK